MTSPQDPLDAACRLGEALRENNIPYAIGGALALGVWAIPRATMDVDINVFVEPEDLDPVFRLLKGLGVELDVTRAQSDARDRGMFEAHWGDFRIDVFTPSIDFSREAERTRRLQTVGDTELYFLVPEALAVFELLFFRGKDIVDLERLIAVQLENLDHRYVREKIVDMMGEEDPRVSQWDRLTSTLLSS